MNKPRGWRGGLYLLLVLHTLSPTDLIPDFFPIFGYVNDMLLLPELNWLSLCLLPTGVVRINRARADAWLATHQDRRRSYVGAALIVCVWGP